MPDQFRIEVDDQEILAKLSEAQAELADMSPLMEEIQGILVDAIERAFKEQKDPTTGAPWAALSEVTKARRGDPNGPILQDSSSLVQSITGRSDATSAEAGVAEKYGVTHQKGAKKGQYGKTARGASIPWGDIPARPFAGLGKDDRDEILAVVKRYLPSDS